MKTTDYIEALKPLAKSRSIYAVAQLLEMRDDTVRHYAKGRRFFDAYACFKVAELLDIPATQVIADVEAERETDEKRRVYWRELARKLAGATAGAVFAITNLMSSDAQASPRQQPSEDGEQFNNCEIIDGVGAKKIRSKPEYKLSRLHRELITKIAIIANHFIPKAVCGRS